MDGINGRDRSPTHWTLVNRHAKGPSAIVTTEGCLFLPFRPALAANLRGVPLPLQTIEAVLRTITPACVSF